MTAWRRRGREQDGEHVGREQCTLFTQLQQYCIGSDVGKHADHCIGWDGPSAPCTTGIEKRHAVLLLHRSGCTSRPLYSACHAAMSCSPAAEDTWGPVVSRDCRGGFDFTLLFEEAILTLAPLAIAGAYLH